ncbi:hypothetical protein JB92DRAFT_763540 [Gautieria morchelliformis]|nr:hypothetical protein JB92DRAFT_763540 [Gautieria morchelliformis]
MRHVKYSPFCPSSSCACMIQSIILQEELPCVAEKTPQVLLPHSRRPLRRVQELPYLPQYPIHLLVLHPPWNLQICHGLICQGKDRKWQSNSHRAPFSPFPNPFSPHWCPFSPHSILHFLPIPILAFLPFCSLLLTFPPPLTSILPFCFPGPTPLSPRAALLVGCIYAPAPKSSQIYSTLVFPSNFFSDFSTMITLFFRIFPKFSIKDL